MNKILEYLTTLEQNNNREWYHANKELYKEANKSFEALIYHLMLSLREGDKELPLAEPKALTFKLTRDTRFSHDKSPYNPSFHAHLSYQGKLPIPVGYYLMIRPGDRSFLGGGLFTDMFKNATTMVRDYIMGHGEEWEKIISASSFAENFSVGGIALKNVPRGYDPTHPQAEYLKNKSWYLEYPVSDKQLTDINFIDFATDIFLKMKPFNLFLNRALKDFQMPAR